MWGQDKPEVKRSEGETEEATTESIKPTNEDAGDIIAFVGKGVEFKGTISYSGTVRIDGLLDGEIHTDGILLIGEEAVIQAKVTAGTIVCKGKITGDIAAKERVKLRAPAVFNGSMRTPMLAMEDGVLFNGGLEMNQGIPSATLHSVAAIGQPSIKRAS
jgi:cytoskeletal protein CcmA (bactofilin family)